MVHTSCDFQSHILDHNLLHKGAAVGKVIKFFTVLFFTIGLLGESYAQQGEVAFTDMRCLDFVNGQGNNSMNKPKAELAKLWIVGYFSGFYQGKETLKWSDTSNAEGKLVSSILSKCRENPESTLGAVAEFVASARKRSIPNTLSNEFSPKTYTCGDHVIAMQGSAGQKLKAEMADLWAFAFVEGYQNSIDPDVVIPVENKPAIIGAINSNCSKNETYAYFDLVSAIAKMVKFQ